MIYLMVTITKENIRMRGLNFEIEETGFNQCLDQNVIKKGLNNVSTLFNGSNLKVPDTHGSWTSDLPVSPQMEGRKL